MTLSKMIVKFFIYASIVAGIRQLLKMYNPIADIFPIQRDIDDHIDDFEEVDII